MKVPQSSGIEPHRPAQKGPSACPPRPAGPIWSCAITDRLLWGQSEAVREDALLQQTARLAETGVDFIQLREKDLPAKELIALTRRLLAALRRASTPSGRITRLLVNSRADVAAAAGADGVHLPSGADQLTPAQVREVLDRARETGADESGARGFSPGQLSIVSVSCHNLAEVEAAREGGADFLLFGPVFGKSVRGGPVVPPAGLAALAAACRAAGSVPVLALGGITAENTTQCIAAGAAGVAGIRLFR